MCDFTGGKGDFKSRRERMRRSHGGKTQQLRSAWVTGRRMAEL